MTTSNTPAVQALPFKALARRVAIIVALCALVATITATWLTSSPASAGPKKATPAAPRAPKAPAAPKAAAVDDDGADDEDEATEPRKPKTPKAAKGKQALVGKLNLNNATVEQLQMLPGVGPSKAERVVSWRQKNGAFKRVADLRKVKGFGYKTLKKLEQYLDIKGETTLAGK